MSKEAEIRPPAAFPVGGGEMARRIREFDWSKTPIGPLEGWPRALQTALQIVLDSRYPMFVWWGPSRINVYNDAYISVLGQRHPAALGAEAAVVWRDIWTTVGPQSEQVLRDGHATWSEHQLLVMERNGYAEETYFTYSYSPVLDDSGRIGGVFCACTEETERVIGQRRLAALRRLVESTAERTVQATAAAAIRSLEAEAYDVSFAALYLMDGERRTLELVGAAGLEPGSAFAPRRLAVAGEGPWPLSRALAGHRVVLDDLEARGLPGAPWAQPTSTAMVLPLDDASQHRPLGVLVIGTSPCRPFDEHYRNFCELVAASIGRALTTARAYEQERDRAEALAELDRAKTTFFSNVSHEFRTPLTLMLGPIEEELARDGHDDDTRQRLEVVHRSGLRLFKLVNTLLDFSRIEAGRASGNFAPVALDRLTGDLASVFRSAIERAGLRYVVHCDPVPEPVWVDPEMWEKIVLNLLNNALKHTFEGEIAVRLRWLGEAAELSVSDSGVGIAPNELERVFERFHRVQGVRARSHEGTGIGLALVRELSRLHGGEVSVRSRVGEGSTFVVRIPRGRAHLPADRIVASPTEVHPREAAAHVEEAAQWNSSATRAPVSVPSDRERLLVVDDNGDMRDYVARLLGEHWRVDVANDGGQALEILQRGGYDLVISDVMMPGVDGYALLEALRRADATANLPVILLSARAGDEAKLEGLRAGADDYVIKPFTASELVARVRGLLELKRIREASIVAVRRSEVRFRAIFESAVTGILVVDDRHRIVQSNPRIREMLGRPELDGTSLDALIPAEAEAAHEAMRTALEQHRRWQGELLLRHADGHPIECEWAVVVDDSGLCMAMVADIGARKHLDRERERLLETVELERARLREALRQMPCGLAVVDPHGKVVLSSRETPRIIGYEMAPLDDIEPPAGRGYAVDEHGGRLPSDDYPLVRALRDRVVTHQREMRYVFDGLERTLSLNAAPLVDRNGVLTGAVCTFEDVSERKALIAELEAAHARWKDIVEGIEETFTIVDRSWQIVYANRKVTAILGLPLAQLVGRSFWDFLPPAHRDTIAPHLYQAMSERRISRFELLGPATGRWFQTVVYPTRDGIALFAQDIDDRKRAESALREADRRKDEFMALLAHELRNPLAPIRTGVEVLRNLRLAAGAADKALTIIDRQVVQMVRLIDDLLDVSRIARGKILLRRQRLDLVALLRTTIEDFHSAIEAGGLLLHAELPAVPMPVYGDAARLAQAFGNLVSNAIKFTDRGGRLNVAIERVGGTARVRFGDDGIGMDEQVLARIFEPFAQADRSLSRSGGGLGLGLALVRGFIELHGGRVTARSAGLGHGSEFVVELPITSTSEHPRASMVAERPVPPDRLRVLIVEDNVDAASMLSIFLEMAGHRVAVAHDGTAGIEEARRGKPDAIICDIGLPGVVDGYGVARILRESMPTVLLVALTGYGQDEVKARAQAAGFDRHLTKPVDPSALQRLLADHAERLAGGRGR